MAREKVRHIFNKNHVEILKISNPEPVRFITSNPTYQNISTSSYRYSHTFYDYWDKKKEKSVKKVSPLGFYYTSIVSEPKKGEKFKGGSMRTIVTYPVPGEKDTYYQLKYITQYNENIIGGEDGLRPWDIYPGDKSFPDSMLDALLKEVNTFFSIAESGKIKEFKLGRYENSGVSSFNSVKCEVYSQLFGNKNGPRFQTDEEKILAHGFDPKYSFRKDKEKK
jgi:hypothetical protein